MSGYVNSFWDSIRGTQLAEVLIKELPKLNRKEESIEELTSKVDALSAKVDELNILLGKIAEK